MVKILFVCHGNMGKLRSIEIQQITALESADKNARVHLENQTATQRQRLRLGKKPRQNE